MSSIQFLLFCFFERWGKEWDEKNQQFAIFQIPHIFGNLKNYRETFIYFHICNSRVYMCMANALIFANSYTGSAKTVTTMLSNRTAYCGRFLLPVLALCICAVCSCLCVRAWNWIATTINLTNFSVFHMIEQYSLSCVIGRFAAVDAPMSYSYVTALSTMWFFPSWLLFVFIINITVVAVAAAVVVLVLVGIVIVIVAVLSNNCCALNRSCV